MTAPTTPARVQLRRTKGWRMPENTVVVARPTPWGNRAEVHKAPDGWYVFDGPDDDEPTRHHTRDQAHYEAVAQYRVRLKCDGALAAQVALALRGKNLACWCPLDQPCHADVLLEIANG